MTKQHITFGVFIPQGWKMELVKIPTAAEKWQASVDIAKRAEQLGFDSIWVYDHFHNVPRPAHEAVFECWTVMAAMSQITTKIRLGQMVGCALYRPPALLAKITSTLDVISGGRLDWGIGAGWYENEFRSYGYQFPVRFSFATLNRSVVSFRLQVAEVISLRPGRNPTSLVRQIKSQRRLSNTSKLVARDSFRGASIIQAHTRWTSSPRSWQNIAS